MSALIDNLRRICGDANVLTHDDPSTDLSAWERDWRKRFPKLKLSRLGRFVRKNQLPAGALRLAEYHGYEHLR